MKEAFFLWVFSCTILTARSQLPDYYVYLFRGDVVVKQGNKKPQKVKPKMLLYRGDILTSNKKNGAIILVDKNENFVKLQITKDYRLQDAMKITSESSEGITKKYLHLLWEELLKPHTDFNAFRKSNLVHVVGGVERGSECDIGSFPVSGMVTAADPLTFYWNNFSATGKYTFRLYQQNGVILYDITIRDTQLVVHPEHLAKLPSNQYYWAVRATDKPCTYEERNSLQLITPQEKQKLLKTLTDSVAVVTDTLQRLLRMAEILERNGMFSEAEQTYQQALAQEDSRITALMLSAFYARSGLLDKARKLFEWQSPLSP